MANRSGKDVMPLVVIFLSFVFFLLWRLVNRLIVRIFGWRWFYRNVYLRMPSWRLARRVKFLVSGRRCARCGTRRNLDVHHRSYRHLWREWLYPQELQVLCRRHHVRLHGR